MCCDPPTSDVALCDRVVQIWADIVTRIFFPSLHPSLSHEEQKSMRCCQFTSDTTRLLSRTIVSAAHEQHRHSVVTKARKVHSSDSISSAYSHNKQECSACVKEAKNVSRLISCHLMNTRGELNLTTSEYVAELRGIVD